MSPEDLLQPRFCMVDTVFVSAKNVAGRQQDAAQTLQAEYLEMPLFGDMDRSGSIRPSQYARLIQACRIFASVLEAVEEVR